MKPLLLILGIAIPALAQQRFLHWDELAVKARLDEEGRLHVREQQTIVFFGDWNGGERVFRVEPHQTLTLHGVERLSNGELIPLRGGSVAEIDGYTFDGRVLRWRSRMPGDPPFQYTPLTYVIDYTLENILVKRGSRYLLDHDFAFTDRDGEIKRFSLDLETHSVWESADLQHHVERTSIPPGQGVVVRGTLVYQGTGAPSAARDTLPARLALAVLLLVVPALLWRRFVGREAALGRLAPLDLSIVTPEWIAKHVLPIDAEVVGGAWDETMSASEVSALLARWAAEKKVKATPHGDELHMKLLVPRDEFPGYERVLIDKLFFAGDDTNTSAVRTRYRKDGFSPANLIGTGVMSKANELLVSAEPVPRVSKFPSLLLFALAVAATIMETRRGSEASASFYGTLVACFLCWLISIFIALHWRARIDHGLEKTRALRVFAGIPLALALAALAFDWFAWPAKLAMAAAALFVVNNAFNIAKSKRGPSAIAFRKRLAAVRQYFLTELAKPNPAIDDDWFPYVIAFGLDDQATKWMRDFGGAAASQPAGGRRAESPSLHSSSSSSPQWTGGGGSFGGAGATGAWTAAAAGIAAGVSPPSSSGSSGGGGSSSSGGGGGGGW